LKGYKKQKKGGYGGLVPQEKLIGFLFCEYWVESTVMTDKLVPKVTKIPLKLKINNTQKKFNYEVGLGLLTDQQITEIVAQQSSSAQKGLTFSQLRDLDKYGYVIIPNVLSQSQIDECISELWDILEATPHQPQYQLKRPNNPLGALTSSEIKTLDTNWVPHKNYGMINEPPIWHTQTHWKLRQDPFIYHIFSQILGTDQIWCTIDRGSIKLPGQGEEEFNHWDYDPWHPMKASFQGIINMNERHFRCVPGSNTVEWHNDFKKTYDYLNSKKQRPMVILSKENDPWNLGQILPDDDTPSQTPYNCIRDIVCPAGSLIIFSGRLMHSVAKNTSNKISYGLYLSFFPAGNRPLMAVYNRSNWKQWSSLHPNVTEGDTELGDRLRSYQTGTAPYRFPGGGITQYIPLRTFKWVIRKREPQSIGKHPKTGHPWIFEKPPANYQPPPLTDLGRKILGFDQYPNQSPQALKLTPEELSKLQYSGWY